MAGTHVVTPSLPQTEAAVCGAKFVYPSFGVTLRANQREYFYRKLDALFPGIKDKYIKSFGEKYICSSPRARYLHTVFAEECNRLGLKYRMQDIVNGYKARYEQTQLTLFPV